MDIQTLFKLAMKRPLPVLKSQIFEGRKFDIGASGAWAYAEPLGLPGWSFPRDRIPANADSVGELYCFHFLEHLCGTDAIAFLREAERVLIPQASVMNICVPYYNSGLMAQDLTHKSFWNEDTFRNLFSNNYYSPAGNWRLRVHFQLIAGIVERNMCILAQIVKD